MNDLMASARGYLESAGFKILLQESQCLVADKLVFGQDRATWIVWPVPTDEDPRRYESKLADSISKMRSNYPDAAGYVLAQSRGGFSRDFLQTLSDKRVSLSVPVLFFDAPFNVDEAPKAASAIQEIRSLETLRKRVAQPYRREESPTDSTDGGDLFDLLRGRYGQPGKPTIRIIVGRAGIGKSVLFRAVFASQYDEFLKSKRRYNLATRPIPLVPEYLKGTYALRTELLVENFLRTDVASPVERKTFEWLLVNGFASWLLDGLDELYAGDPNFFGYLSDLLTHPGSKAQITIWCRDSLLTTSDAFVDFRELCGEAAMLEIYHLKEWERSSKRAFAWLELAGRRPGSDERDPEPVQSFLTAIDRSPALKLLSGLPFYCHLLITQFRESGLREFSDDLSMLKYTVDEMIKREVDKGLLDLRLLIDGGLDLWLEEIALAYVEEGRYSDIDREKAIEYGRLVLREGVDEQTEEHILTSLLQFPLFKQGTESQKVAFAHDLIADFLAARGYSRRILKQPRDVASRLSRFEPQDSPLYRFIARNLGPQEEAAIGSEIQRGALTGRSLAAILSLLMMARPDYDLVKRTRREFDGQNLSGLRFYKRDLSEVCFRGADLSNATFEDCDLQRVRFEGAFLSRTRFEGSNRLEEAQFGDLSRIDSILAGRRLHSSPAEIREWIGVVTGRPQQHGEPCPTALQLVRMFTKFVTPLGTPRRDELSRRPLLGGRIYPGAASPEECLEQSVTEGYLTGPDFRDRFRRPEGDKYAEMVAFVRDSRVSDSLGRLIASMCRRRGCVHQIRV